MAASPVADETPSPTTPGPPATPRTPRTSSLSRSEDRTPRNVALPASPMPHPRLHEMAAPLPPGLAQQESGPAGLGIDFPSRQSLSGVPPPLPTKKNAPASIDFQPAPPPPAQAEGSTPLSSSTSHPPRSPGGRSLRSSKPWKTSSDKGDKSGDSSLGEKSPLGAFFTKPTFKFFNKKGDGELYSFSYVCYLQLISFIDCRAHLSDDLADRVGRLEPPRERRSRAPSPGGTKVDAVRLLESSRGSLAVQPVVRALEPARGPFTLRASQHPVEPSRNAIREPTVSPLPIRHPA